jgi:DNA-binding NarL/FixJ family response regulator
MMKLFILADHSERIREVSRICGSAGVDITLHSAAIERFDPGTPTLWDCDAIVLDHGAPVSQRMQLVEALREAHAGARVLVTNIPRIGETDRTELIFKYLEHGAAGYVGTDAPEQVAQALAEIVAGGAWIEPALTAALVQRTVALRASLATLNPHTFGSGQPDALTRRQIEVLELLAAGMTNREIADELYISVGTVKNHVHRILDVLEASTRNQAAEYYQFFQAPTVAA